MQKYLESNPLFSHARARREISLTARAGQVCATMFLSNQLVDEEGVIHLTQSELVLSSVMDRPRVLGYVVAVGEKVSGVQFGDFVEIRSSTGGYRGQFLNVPLRDLCGDYDRYAGKALTYLNTDGPGRVEAEADDRLMLGYPDMLLYRINSLDGRHPDEPLFDHMLVRNEPRYEESRGLKLCSDYYRNPNPLGQVIKIGSTVEEVALGDWVFVEMNEGTLIRIGGVEHTLIHESNIALKFSEKPSAAFYTNEGFSQTL